ncbi:MAG TPA: hypothetical protein VFC74_09855 [Oscillospiraceae bacterium]|nr:hypothetical protein [Oscillospiraceae bacterium]
MQNIKNNKPLVKVIVLLICGGLVLSSVAAAIISITEPQPTEDPSAIYRSQLAQVETVIVQTEKSLEEKPGNVALLKQLGNAYYTAGQLQAALNEAEKSLESFAQALEPYGKVLEQEPDNVEVLVDRAVAAYASENNEIAQEDFEKAIAVAPNHAKARFNYGVFLYFGLAQPEEALAHWQKVVELNPEDEQELVATTKTWIKAVEAELAEQAAELEAETNEEDSAKTDAE